MPRHLPFSLLGLCVLTLPSSPAVAEEADGPVYELRIYTCAPDRLDALSERFAKHTISLFNKHGMESVAYWVPTDEPKSQNTLIYLLRHKSQEAAKASWDGFRNDPDWKAVAAEWREKYGKVLAQAPESTYLTPTDYSPKVTSPASESLYELRVYTANEGKLDALHARFRDHTDKIFRRHGLKAYAYWKPMDQPKSEKLLVYILEHPNRAQARMAWRAFGGDPDWRAARAASEADGPLLETRPESIYMRLTDYSPHK